MRSIPQTDRLVAALAYLTLVPGAVLLILPQYRESRFVRFHAWQSVFLWGLFAVLAIVSLLLSNLAAAMFFLLFGILIALAMFFLWIVLSFKAFQGDRFELPLLGALAERMR
jgi:uncharacterized membrane protein